jgi:hypothetical protein
MAEPLVGVETLFRHEREAKSMFQGNPGLESLEDARTSLYSFRL